MDKKVNQSHSWYTVENDVPERPALHSAWRLTADHRQWCQVVETAMLH